MRYFPLSIDTRDKKLLLIGGGQIAQRKIQSLLSSELTFYVIAEEFSPDLLALAKEYPDRILLKSLSIDQGFVFFNYDFLILATNDPRLNEALEKRAKSSRVPCLRLDESDKSDFILNKVVERDSLVASISTGGKNPTVSKIIGQDLEKFLDQYDPQKIQILNEIRQALVKKNKDNVGQIIRSLWEEEAITLNTYLEDVDEDKIRD